MDVIGDRITEINVTSPTCVQEIEAAYDVDITGMLFDAIEKTRKIKKLGSIIQETRELKSTSLNSSWILNAGSDR